LGFHLVSALAIHLLPQADRRRFTLAVVPALHGGVGARLWSGGSATINGQDLHDPTVTDSAIAMSGKETFLRFSLGWWW